MNDNRGIDLSHAEAETPQPPAWWREASEHTRLTRVRPSLVSALGVDGSLQRCLSSGYVQIDFTKDCPASVRGELLLALEKRLNQEVCEGVTVWLEPQIDKNVLRKYRGVEVK